MGERRADLLGSELGIFTCADLLHHFPFRYQDCSVFYEIAALSEQLPFVQIKGVVRQIERIGEGKKKRLEVRFADATGEMNLVWFAGAKWVAEKLKIGEAYVAIGKPNKYGRYFSIAHPEFELLRVYEEKTQQKGLLPVYRTTEKLKKASLNSRAIARMMSVLLNAVADDIHECLPDSIMRACGFISRQEAMLQAHFPENTTALIQAQNRLKFEELFFVQIRLYAAKSKQKQTFKGQVFSKLDQLHNFYHNHLPFALTDAQKRVIREIFTDLRSGKQMNRLLQGDVGSGKTIVAFIVMLIAVNNQAQACLMAPTEILAQQHYEGLRVFSDKIGITLGLLTGSTKTKARREIDAQLRSGALNIIVGTHALLEDKVDFKNLGLCVIDEQHRFGVAQRAKLWKKQSVAHPHILVMTATPIPRTLAMTLYGDLDLSVIDTLPPGRKPIKTLHYYESSRLRVFGFLQQQIDLGRQVYIVYPLIEESAKLDYNNLMDGYESIRRTFPKVPLSIVHGKMKPADKAFEMTRFVEGKTKIMVATTVIEVGVNVPNASVMLIENAEKFGLSQLHQLRGRVGRGHAQSFCLLMSSLKLSKEAKIRLKTMVRTNNGFEIADTDLKLRGPGDLEGTKQSGILDFKFADLGKDLEVLQKARHFAEKILEDDPQLLDKKHQGVRNRIREISAEKGLYWGRIS